MAVGRISGPLLKANLLRDGIDLAFETDLLYLDVNNRRIGINTTTPSHDLQVNGTTRTTNLEVTNQLDVSPYITITGNTISSTSPELNILPAAGGIVYQNVVTVDQIDIYNNRIITNSSNADLEIEPNGTGEVKIFSDTVITGNLHTTGNITADGDITIGGNVTIGNNTNDNIVFEGEINSDIVPNIPVTYNLGSAEKRWQTLYTQETIIGDITINTNVITTNVSNANLELRANGSGAIKFEDYTVDENVITVNTDQDMVLEPLGIGIVDINSTQAIRLPRGTTAERPGTPLAGMIRYNTDNNNYEGYDGTYWRVLNGVYDVDQNTYLVAEATPGANDNTFYFYINGSQVADLNDTRLNVLKIDVDNITIDGNTINTNSNASLFLTSYGTGKVKIENFSFKNNVITNTIADSVTELQHTGSGYFKIAGSIGFVIPVGDANQRPNMPIKGFMRYNTDDDRVEIFDGTIWQGAAGASVGVSVPAATEIAILSALMVG